MDDLRETNLYIGTNTQGTGSKGIYLLQIDAQGMLTQKKGHDHTENPSFLISSGQGRLLHACSEMEGFSAISSYRIREDGQLQFLKRVQYGGSGMCYLSVVPGSAFLGACYQSGTLLHVGMGADGLPTKQAEYVEHEEYVELAECVEHMECDEHAKRGDAIFPMKLPPIRPHAHAIVPERNARFAFATDLGLDRIFVYRISGDGLHRVNDATVAVRKGEGPRHFVFHPVLSVAYLCTEYGNHVFAYHYDEMTGCLSQVQELSTLPPGVTAASFCADIRISPDGRTLLASNRGHNSIACFHIGCHGILTPIGHIPSWGQYPRGFAITPDGRFLVMANQNSNQVVSIPFRPDDWREKTSTISAKPDAIGTKPLSICEIPAPTWVCPVIFGG